jgi:hypothetical protein
MMMMMMMMMIAKAVMRWADIGSQLYNSRWV